MTNLKNILMLMLALTIAVTACNNSTETTTSEDSTVTESDDSSNETENEAEEEEPEGALTELQIMEKEVMRIHDEAMMHINKVRSLKKEVEEAKVAAQAEKADEAVKVAEHIINQLQKADDRMQEWMSNYEVPAEDAPDELATTYFEKEEEKITAIKETILNSISVAEAFLKKTDQGS